MQRSEQREGTGFSVGGFVVDPEQFELVRGSFASAAAFADERVLGIFALRTALSLGKGETVEDRIVTPMPVRTAPDRPAFGKLRMELSPDELQKAFDPTQREAEPE